MDITNSVILRNIPSDIKLAEQLVSSEASIALKDIFLKQPNINIQEVEIIFKGGTPSKEIISKQS